MSLGTQLPFQLLTCEPPWAPRSVAKNRNRVNYPSPAQYVFKGPVVSPERAPLFAVLQNSEELSDDELEDRVADVARQITSVQRGAGLGMLVVPEALLQQNGALAERVIRRAWDLHLAFKTLPLVRRGLGYSTAWPTAWAEVLCDVALKRFYVRLFRKELHRAVLDWIKDVGLYFEAVAKREQTSRDAPCRHVGRDTLLVPFNMCMPTGDRMDAVLRLTQEMRLLSFLDCVLRGGRPSPRGYPDAYAVQIQCCRDTVREFYGFLRWDSVVFSQLDREALALWWLIDPHATQIRWLQSDNVQKTLQEYSYMLYRVVKMRNNHCDCCDGDTCAWEVQERPELDDDDGSEDSDEDDEEDDDGDDDEYEGGEEAEDDDDEQVESVGDKGKGKERAWVVATVECFSA